MNNFLKKDSTIRITSIIIAIILWFYVVDIQNPEAQITVKDVPVKLVNVEAIEEFGLSVMNKEKQSVTLVFKGRRKSLVNINNKSINAFADLKGLNKSGEYPVMIQVDLPADRVDIIDKKPYNLMVVLDHLVQVQKEVKIVTTGVLGTNFVALEPEVKPNTVTLKGPSSKMNSIEDLRVYVDLNGQTKDIITKQKYEIYNKNNEKVTSAGITADVDVVEIVYPIIKTKEIPVVLDTEGSVRDDLALINTEIKPDRIKISGREEDVDKATQALTYLVNINNIQKDTEVEVPIRLPAGVNFFESPEKVKIKINVEKQINRTFQVENIKVVNVPEGLSYMLSTKKLNITLKGSESKLKNMEGTSINVSADISNLDVGVYDVPVRVNAGADISVVGAHTVSVKISRQGTEDASDRAAGSADEAINDSGTSNNQPIINQ